MSRADGSGFVPQTPGKSETDGLTRLLIGYKDSPDIRAVTPVGVVLVL